MSVWVTLLIYVLIPLAVYGLIALLTLGPKAAHSPKYRPGDAWTYPPQWWTANPAGLSSATDEHHPAKLINAAGGNPDESTATTGRGGASGRW
ncbi:MAG: hypothetical protein J2O49_02865 [Sciscionella sp.]|nr:hypothetical protein [Sciscionella sp.]